MPPFFPHALAMAAGFLCMCCAGLTVLFFRRKPWWLKAHRAFGIIAPLCMLLGWLAIMLRVHGASESLIQTIHGACGVFVLALAVATPLLGWLQFSMQNRLRMRMLHRLSGRAVIIAAACEVCLGLFMVML